MVNTSKQTWMLNQSHQFKMVEDAFCLSFHRDKVEKNIQLIRLLGICDILFYLYND